MCQPRCRFMAARGSQETFFKSTRIRLRDCQRQEMRILCMPTKKRASGKRTRIAPHKGDSRFIRRDTRGRVKESDDVGRSLKQDRARKAKKTVKSGDGERGDQRRRS